MIIRSDKIQAEDVRQAVAHARAAGQDVYLIDAVRSFTPRRKRFGCEVFLGSANGRHASAHDPEWKAASWVAWGEVIDYLSLLDPEATIGFYANRQAFLEYTSAEAERPGRPESRSEMPWLVRHDEWQRRDALVTKALGIAPGETLVVDGIQLDGCSDEHHDERYEDGEEVVTFGDLEHILPAAVQGLIRKGLDGREYIAYQAFAPGYGIVAEGSRGFAEQAALAFNAKYGLVDDGVQLHGMIETDGKPTISSPGPRIPASEVDVRVHWDGGSIVLLWGISDDGVAFLDERLDPDCARLGSAYAVETRYAGPILDAVEGDGLVVGRAG